MQDVLTAVMRRIKQPQKLFENSMQIHSQDETKKPQIRTITQITRTAMLKIKAEIIGEQSYQKVEEMSIDRVYELLKLKLQIELE